MFCAHEKFGRTVPDRHDYFVPDKQRLKRLVDEPRKPKISYFHDACRGNQDVGGLKVTVQDVTRV